MRKLIVAKTQILTNTQKEAIEAYKKGLTEESETGVTPAFQKAGNILANGISRAEKRKYKSVENMLKYLANLETGDEIIPRSYWHLVYAVVVLGEKSGTAR